MVRKGVGYTVEAFIASLTLFVFVVGGQTSVDTQDWSSYRLQVEAQDLTEVMETTGGIDILERGETGTVRTLARHASGGNLAVSGAVDIPVQEFTVGFPILNGQRQADLLTDNLPRCRGRLDEIDSDPAADILRPQSGDRNGARLYIADTDPRVVGGGNGVVDYDTLYVDNNTECQFTPSEGPFYLDNYFNYSNGSVGTPFQFKNVTGASGDEELVYHDASQVLRLRSLTSRDMNGVETSVSFDTINISKASLPDYQLLVFRKDDSLTMLDNEENRLEAFAERGGSLLLLMDLQDDDFDPGEFLYSTDLSWISDMSYTLAGDPSFSTARSSRSTEIFMSGIGGDINSVSLNPEGAVSSAPDEGTAPQPLVAYQNSYDGDDWNVTDWSMSRVDPADVSGEPRSACYSNGRANGNLTEGDFSLVSPGGATVSRQVINAELGSSESFCKGNDVRALMVDFDADGAYESSEGEGPFVEGDRVTRAGRSYTPVIPDNSTAQLEFAGNTDVEVVNYIDSYYKGRLGRAAYRQSYSSPERKLVVALMYQLLPENSVFGSGDSSASLEVVSSTNESFYMPYTANLRWSSQ